MNDTSNAIIEVAIPLPLDQTFSYRVPESLRHGVETGRRVLVPFGRRKLTAYILGFAGDEGRELREIVELLDDGPLFTPEELEFYRWAAAYYLHPLGEVIKAALPAGINIQSSRKASGEDSPEEVLTGGRTIKTETFFSAMPSPQPVRVPKGKAADLLAILQERGEASAAILRREFGDVAPQLHRLRKLGLVAATAREVYRDPFRAEVFEHDTPLALNSSQAAALESITATLSGRKFTPFLLYGVTGSGKTEVYLQAIAHALDRGKTALVLVPEISLTPQLVNRFKRRFRCGIAVLHSALSDGERYDEWRRIRRGEAAIVIGARSAIFAPLRNIGIIVVDEEHEASYKQSEGFRYNARDLALVRGKMDRAAVILGSATPQLTSWHAAATGKLTCLHLPERVNSRPLPTVEIIDARGQRGEIVLPPMAGAIAGNLSDGGQTLIFLNRRGFATFLICEDCGKVLQCPNCSVTLTYHRGKNRHCCHYCDYTIPAPSLCQACNGGKVSLLGQGTEQVEEKVRALFPDARIDRMDRDTTARKGGHARILRKVAERRTDILIGTQMVAKGHDFPGITLVGILSVEATLNIPDYRSAERTFQLVTQLIGRAGRGDDPGHVLIQSLNPDHYALTNAAQGDPERFYSTELEFRRDAQYPPYAYLAAIYLTGSSAQAVEKEAQKLAEHLQGLRSHLKLRVEILGPAPPPLAKLRGRFRWQFLLKSASRASLHHLLSQCKVSYVPPSIVRFQIDIDPVDLV